MIHVGYISTLGRLRELDKAQVAALADSIREVGLLNPITVYRREIVRNGQNVEGYGLIAGMHRLEACKSLGWQEIPAIVVELDDNDRIIAECDENLCGTKLSATERASFTAKRKEAYLRKHPETAHGKASPAKDDKLSSFPTFAEDQATKTGVDKRTVQRDAERGEKITPGALAMVKGTSLDTGRFLDRLTKVKPENQRAYVDAELKRLRRPSKPKKAIDAEEASERRLQAAINAVTKLSKDELAEFQAWFEDHVDQPVFDQTSCAA